jgi:hypothetical protein
MAAGEAPRMGSVEEDIVFESMGEEERCCSVV